MVDNNIEINTKILERRKPCMGKDVNIICDADLNRIHGESEGYSYSYLESTSNGRAVYTVSDPDGNGKLAELTHDGINELTDSPKDFWDKYCK